MKANSIMAEDRRMTIQDNSYVGNLVRKWEPFLEGLPVRNKHEQYVAGVTAILMENQSKWLKSLTEETRTQSVGSFTKFIFPVLRRVFPNLIAHELVSVQPMTAAVGQIFYLNYVPGDTKGATRAGNIFPRDFDRNYSGQYVPNETIGVGDGTNFGGAGTALGATLKWTPALKYDATRGYAVIIKEIDSDGNVVQTATDNGSNAFTFSPTGGSVAGAINYQSGVISGFKFQTEPANGNLIQAFYYYDNEATIKIPQMNLDIQKATIEVQSRKLRANWSAEAAEDLKNFHGIDAEVEMVSTIAQEISYEIDREILEDLYQASSGTTATFDRIPPSLIPEIDHIRAILTSIGSVSSSIATKTKRGPANWLVTSPAVSNLVQQLSTHGDFRPAMMSGGESSLGPMDMPRPLTTHGQFGIYKMGTVQNKWILFEDPDFREDKMLVGLKGDGFLNAGYVFAPHIPLQMTPSFQDPSDFVWKKAFRTRYGRKLTRPEFYGNVTVENL